MHREAKKLSANAGQCFTGFYTRGMGFVITPEEASVLIAKGGDLYREVVAPFINGENMVRRQNQDPARWVIDMERWWQFWNTRMGIRKAVKDMPRFAICGLTGKRLLLSWAEPNWRPSHACGVFAFDDDYSFGVCTSKLHELWARANGSTLKGDLRYTPSTVFETFPFPKPSESQRARISAAAQSIISFRRVACDSIGAGLTKVYNLMDDGGFVELKATHRELDLAVADAYGWDATMLDDPARLLDALFDLNARYATDPNYAPFGKNEETPSLLDLSESEENTESNKRQ